jgi:hypothetical protein
MTVTDKGNVADVGTFVYFHVVSLQLTGLSRSDLITGGGEGWLGAGGGGWWLVAGNW